MTISGGSAAGIAWGRERIQMWIESHSELRDHPKLKRLARLLSIDRRTATGLLHWLWWWAMAYAPDGDLSEYEEADIADGLDWDGDPGELMAALRDAGFLDGAKLHDWEDYGEKLFVRRQANAKRMRESRAQHVRNTCGTHAEREDREDIEDNKEEEEDDELLKLALEEIDKSESTTEDYRRTINRYRGKLPEHQIERVIVSLGNWKPDKPRPKLHLTLAKWLSNEKPEPVDVSIGAEPEYPPIVVPEDW